MFDHSDFGNDRFFGVQTPVEAVSETEFSALRPFSPVNALEYRANTTFDIGIVRCVQSHHEAVAFQV